MQSCCYIPKWLRVSLFKWSALWNRLCKDPPHFSAIWLLTSLCELNLVGYQFCKNYFQNLSGWRKWKVSLWDASLDNPPFMLSFGWWQWNTFNLVTRDNNLLLTRQESQYLLYRCLRPLLCVLVSSVVLSTQSHRYIDGSSSSLKDPRHIMRQKTKERKWLLPFTNLAYSHTQYKLAVSRPTKMVSNLVATQKTSCFFSYRLIALHDELMLLK